MEDGVNIWKMIAKELNSEGIDVYPPATHKGQCTKPYVILKQDGVSRVLDYSSARVYYRFQVYVPKERYDLLDVYEKKVKDILDNKLYPLILNSNSQEPDYFDDNYNAHMRAFLYHNTIRLRH